MRVLKWVVPIDDEPHRIGGGPVVLVGSQTRYDVRVWTVESNEPLDPDMPDQWRTVQVYGTGHHVPYGRRHIGSAQAGMFVWHVFEEPSGRPAGRTHESRRGR